MSIQFSYNSPVGASSARVGKLLMWQQKGLGPPADLLGMREEISMCCHSVPVLGSVARPRLSRRYLSRLLCVALLTLTLAPFVSAATTPAQRREANALYIQIRKAGTLYAQGKYMESSDVVRKVQSRVSEMAKAVDEDVLKLLEPIHRRVVRAHALLELEGVELDPIVELRLDPKPMPDSKKTSFVQHVAPILVAKCGRCHVNGNRGEFSMANYDALLRGSTAGAVVFAGDPAGSRMIELIESGDMPRGGGSLSDEQLATLKKWITEGTAFDGEDRQVNLKTMAPNTASGAATTTEVTVTRTPGSESVSFAGEIASVLAERCNGCHVNGQRPRGNLNMTTFAGLIRGGDSGPPVRPRDPTNSLIVQRIKGEGGGQRMPAGRPPLSDELIARIEKWISEGASFDGSNPNQNVVRLAATAKAAGSTHEELSAERARLAESNWRLGMGRVPFDKTETKNFLLLGNVGEATLNELGEQAEQLVPRIAGMLGVPSDQPLLKGRVTLYVFNQRYDYAEFGQMVERRELPKEWRVHWRYDVVDAYGAMLPPRNGEYTVDGLIGQQLAGAYAASLGNPPRWFSEGTARVVAGKLAPKDPRITTWKEALPGVLAASGRPDDFLSGRLPAEDADVASYSFMNFLMKDSRRFNTFLDALRNDQPFDKSFGLVYGASPSKVAEPWAVVTVRALRRR